MPARDFTAAAPNQRWVSDTTEILRQVGGCMRLKSGVIVSAFDSLKVLFEPFEDRFHDFICPLPIHVEVYAVF